jgi:hypothetical protein
MSPAKARQRDCRRRAPPRSPRRAPGARPLRCSTTGVVKRGRARTTTLIGSWAKCPRPPTSQVASNRKSASTLRRSANTISLTAFSESNRSAWPKNAPSAASWAILATDVAGAFTPLTSSKAAFGRPASAFGSMPSSSMARRDIISRRRTPRARVNCTRSSPSKGGGTSKLESGSGSEAPII